MKSLTLMIIFLVIYSSATAQLAGTKWSGIMNVPGETETILDFKKDTLNLVQKDNGEIFESMKYTIASDVINLVKTNGVSPCEIGFKASLKFVITDNQLKITFVNAECEGWATAWNEDPFKRE